jgi:hypothetical protein
MSVASKKHASILHRRIAGRASRGRAVDMSMSLRAKVLSATIRSWEAPSEAALQEELDRIFSHTAVNEVFPAVLRVMGWTRNGRLCAWLASQRLRGSARRTDARKAKWLNSSIPTGTTGQ